MRKRSGLNLFIIAAAASLLLILTAFGSFYVYWNNSPPGKTCGSCHEIGRSVEMFAQSAHRDLACSECHGTAISNGLHSLREKGAMVVNHVRSEFIEDIRLTEDQGLEVMSNCKRCHSDEYAAWMSGGHSALYHDIFLDKKHNETEQINADCLRCHGMFSDVPVVDLVEPLDKKGPWSFKVSGISEKPVIPCMACHQSHRNGRPAVRPDYANPDRISYSRQDTSVVVSYYYRPDRRSIPAENLPVLKLKEGERQVLVSDDITMRLCVQCHAPNARHDAGTSDDRTPRGVHEGLSCTACHENHSNNSANSCNNCHPAISNCKLDVKKMNTTYYDPESKNDIHSVKCTDCHKEENIIRKKSVITL
jgi:hypothetical protein